jgi:exosortase/archaeosortase family protein
VRAVESGPLSFIAVGRYAVTVVLVPLCSASYGAVLFAGSALLLPFIRVGDRVRALLLYVPALYVANALRILAGVLLGINYGLQYFKYYHDTLSTLITILTFALLWTRWFYTSTRHLQGAGGGLG